MGGAWGGLSDLNNVCEMGFGAGSGALLGVAVVPRNTFLLEFTNETMIKRKQHAAASF